MYIAYLNFFFNDTATTEIYTYGHTLSLHDALPILHLVAEGLGDGIVLGHASIRCPALLEGDHVGVELLAGLDDVEGREPLAAPAARSEEHTSELQSLMRISYAVFCLKKKTKLPSHTFIFTHSHHFLYNFT